jgi:hypothetical protein
MTAGVSGLNGTAGSFDMKNILIKRREALCKEPVILNHGHNNCYFSDIDYYYQVSSISHTSTELMESNIKVNIGKLRENIQLMTKNR